MLPPVAGARRQVALGALALVAFASSLVTSATLFPRYSLNRDDSVYVAMARMLQRGNLTLAAAEQDFFRPWASGVVGDRLVLKYTPPWPSVLAVSDLVAGTPRLALGLVAAATVVLTAMVAGEVLGDRWTGILAGALLALSPLFVLQSATYLPYVFQLVLGLAAGHLLLTGLRTSSGRRLLASGAVFGLALFARPFDAVLFALPFVALLWSRREGLRSLVGRPTRLLALGAAPVLAVALAYNAHVMGSPFTLPYQATGTKDTFGFGRRGVFDESTVRFRPGDGLDGMVTNLWWLPSWTFGGVVLVVLAVLGLRRTTGRARWAVAGLALAFPLGYFAFWGPYAVGRLWPGVQTLGPFYHLPVIVPLVVFGAAGARTLWDGSTRLGQGRGRLLLGGLVVVGLGLTATAVPDKVEANAEIRDDYARTARFVEDLELDDAILFLPRRGDSGFLSSTPFLENAIDLDQPVLYAEERAEEDFELLDRYPDRSAHRLTEDLRPGETTGGALAATELRVDRGTSATVTVEITDTTGAPEVVAYAHDGRTEWRRPLDEGPEAGATYPVTWTVVPAGDGAAPAEGTVELEPGSGVVSFGVEVLEPGQPRERRWEHRIPYRVQDGEVELLRPGTGWALTGTRRLRWVEDHVGNPVQER
jgi:hypothetical protein